jgi:hypothetical protein
MSEKVYPPDALPLCKFIGGSLDGTERRIAGASFYLPNDDECYERTGNGYPLVYTHRPEGIDVAMKARRRRYS